MNFSSVVELRDPTLGRMLVRNLSMSTLSAISDLIRQGVSADQFAAQFFATLARRVPDGILEDRNSYEGGARIDHTEFMALSLDALDSLAAAYLEKTAITGRQSGRNNESSVSPDVSTSRCEQSQLTERHTERLLCSVRNSIETTRKVSGSIAQTIRGTDDALRKTLETINGPTDALRRSFEQTSLLARGIDDALSKIPTLASDRLTPTLEPPSPKFSQDLVIPENPVWETNRRLAELIDSVTQLVGVARQQAELSQAIRNASDLALTSAIQSENHANAAASLARKGVGLTLLAIVVAITIGGVGIWFNSRQGTATDGRLEEEIRLLSEISGQVKVLNNRSAVDSATTPKSQKITVPSDGGKKTRAPEISGRERRAHMP